MPKMIIPRTADLDNTTVLGDASDSLRDLFQHTLWKRRRETDPLSASSF
jgi:hypothetical protein